MEYLVQGIFLGAPYALVAIGYVVIYNAIRAYQFAHGCLAMLAAYFFLLAYDHLGQSIPIAIIVMLAGVLLLSLIFSVAAFERLLGRHFPSLVAGLGLIIIIDQSVGHYFYSGQPVPFPASMQINGFFRIGSVLIFYNQVVVLGVALIAILVLDQFFRRSRVGMEMRALADTRVGAALSGITVNRTVRYAFLIAGATAALAGLLLGMLFNNITPTTGDDLTIPVMASVLVAGPTSMRGSIIAVVIFGVAQSLAVGYISTGFSQAIAYGVMLIALLIKPNGLFGSVVEVSD